MNKQRNLLVIEDIHNSMKCLLAELLEDEGYLIDEVTNVEAAKKKLLSRKYDAILIDWRIPIHEGGPIADNGGQTILESLTSGQLHVKNVNTPFIIVTAERSIVAWNKVAEFKNFAGCVQKLRPDDVKVFLAELFAKNTVHENQGAEDE